ncbi:metallophosphoesterase [Haloarchaeobius sp. DFWS5]|uniref:metallophosphoesterase n=1 Tax=Haloarchaeobius sp. DFWS5 TaxID=3446114 RepID=UPI003EB9085A
MDRRIEFADRAAYFPDADALVLADLHLGRAHTSNVDFPLNEGHETLDRLDALLEQFSPETVVFAGDVLHSFKTVPVPAREALDRLTERVEREATLVVVRGNHDEQLDRVSDGEVVDSHRLSDGTVVCHGHEAPDIDSDATPGRYVVGHNHPTIEIESRRYPCLLYGPNCYRGGDVVMLPSFTTLAAGVLVNRKRANDFQSPLLARPKQFHPAVRDEESEETLWFPPLGKLRRML